MVVLCFACRKKKPKYSFPLNDEYRLKKWMKILNIRKKPAKISRLCADHFHKRDVYCTENGKYHKVRKDALPIFRNYQEPDIELISASGEKVEAHKVVLAAQSKTFRDILISSENIDCILLPDYSTEMIQILVDLFYDGSTKVNRNQELEVWRLFCHLGLFHIGTVKAKDSNISYLKYQIVLPCPY